eukprot:3214485-Pyramimonas_sp.AAC.1
MGDDAETYYGDCEEDGDDDADRYGDGDDDGNDDHADDGDDDDDDAAGGDYEYAASFNGVDGKSDDSFGDHDGYGGY